MKISERKLENTLRLMKMEMHHSKLYGMQQNQFEKFIMIKNFLKKNQENSSNK